MENKSKTPCHKCNCIPYKLLPNPEDSLQEHMICEDCEYEIIARYNALDNEPIENYSDIRGM